MLYGINPSPSSKISKKPLVFGKTKKVICPFNFLNQAFVYQLSSLVSFFVYLTHYSLFMIIAFPCIWFKLKLAYRLLH